MVPEDMGLKQGLPHIHGQRRGFNLEESVESHGRGQVMGRGQNGEDTWKLLHRSALAYPLNIPRGAHLKISLKIFSVVEDRDPYWIFLPS